MASAGRRRGRGILRTVAYGSLFTLGGTGAAAYYCYKNPQYHPLLASVLEKVPYRAISRTWGEVHSNELPEWARSPIYKGWAYVFNSDLSEADEDDLNKYKNLKEFFTRRLKPGVRPIDSSFEVVSPVDGTVVNFGVVSPDGTLEQIKGQRYSVSEFLGQKPTVSPGKSLYFCTVYLAPGDYHRIHASTSWSVDRCTHFGGYLYPVAPAVVSVVPTLFAVNERVVLEGKWKQGFYSLTAVGATNVGSIELLGNLQKVFKISTNSSEDDRNFFKREPIKYECFSSSPVPISAGDEVALFNLGSTIVLIFEANPNFNFDLKEGQKIKMGQGMGK